MSRDMDEEKLLSGVWPEWKIIEIIGSGSYGKVYKAVREEISIKTFSAIKIISIPQHDSEIQELRTEGYDDAAIKKYYQNITSQLINEIKCLLSLKGATNIVKIDDFKVVDKEDIGCNIYLRMELLTPFNRYILDKKMTQAEMIKFGIDICKALECCNEQNIVHRDIKPDNILVSEHGEFKLGDFGIAKKLDECTATINNQGVSSYIAPEVFKGEKYNIQADIYSLGIVLYKLLNNNRLPFSVQGEGEYGLPSDANMRRLEGEKLPAPVNANKELSAVILRACEYNAEKRFKNPAEFGKALLALQDKEKLSCVPIIDNIDGEGEKTLVANQMMFEPGKPGISKKILIIGILLMMFLFGVGVVFAMSVNNAFTLGEESKEHDDFYTSGTVETTQERADDFTTGNMSEEGTKADSDNSGNDTEDSEIDIEKITEIVTEVVTEEITTEEATTEEATTEEATTEETTTISKYLYMVPSGCAYYDASSEKVYSAGSEIDIIPDKGDELRTTDYVYIYDDIQVYHSCECENYGSLSYTWNVTVKDKTKTEYEEIVDTIAGRKVLSMCGTFEECVNMKNAPEIPNTVIDLCGTFRKCESLELPPKLPNKVKELYETFSYCIRLKEIPEIPESVNSLHSTFAECFSLKHIPSIPDNVTDMGGAFKGCYSIESVQSLPTQLVNLSYTFDECKNLEIAPEIPYGVEIMNSTFSGCVKLREAPVIPDTVKKLNHTFFGCTNLESVSVIPNGVEEMETAFAACTSLKKIPPIPENVKNMYHAFGNCTSLTGDIIVNANPEIYDFCFSGTYNITLKGSSDMLEELEATKWVY